LEKAGEIPPLRSYAVTLRTGTDVRVRAWAEAASAEDANELADAVRGAMALGALVQGSASGLPALESVEIERVDDTLEVSFDVDGRSLREWLFERSRRTRKRPCALAGAFGRALFRNARRWSHLQEQPAARVRRQNPWRLRTPPRLLGVGRRRRLHKPRRPAQASTISIAAPR
jgi:hypothetical protein